jgi:ferredoxin
MTFVITRLCRDCVDGSCVDACPVSAIVQHRPSNGVSDLPRQLFINPEECICCAACVPECPWEAIFDEDAVPVQFEADIALNAITAARAGEFDVPIARLRKGATFEQVSENKARWGLTQGLQSGA